MTTRESRPGEQTRAATSRFAGDTSSLARSTYITAMHHAAVRYASRGWAVLPLQGKIPWTRHGLRDASTDPETIDRWWWQWPTANVGVAVPDRFIVLDVDPRHSGDDTLDALTRRHAPLPDTLVCVTGRGDGGCHFWFLHPGGPLSDRRLGDGLDLRTGGRHYVVAPPSIHPESGRPYAWGNREHIAPPPAWLVSLIRPQVAARTAARPQVATGDRAAALVRHVAALQPGNRNHGLFWAACRAAEEGLLPGLAAELEAAAVAVGLDAGEAAQTIRSAQARVR